MSYQKNVVLSFYYHPVISYKTGPGGTSCDIKSMFVHKIHREKYLEK